MFLLSDISIFSRTVEVEDQSVSQNFTDDKDLYHAE